MHHHTELINSPNNPAPRFSQSENVARFREGMVYAVLFSDGWLKVGRGRDAQARINCHIGTSSMRGAMHVRSVISGVMADSGAAENALIAYCSERGTSIHGREWFTGVDFEVVCEFFDTHFKGDTGDYLAAVREAQSRRMEFMLGAVFALQGTNPPSAARDADELAKWVASLAHARILDRLYRNDIYGGWLFEVGASGMTNFFDYAAITVNTLDEGEIADLFCSASTNPGEALEQIVSTAQALIADFAAEGNQ